jgi:hypothetical protein
VERPAPKSFEVEAVVAKKFVVVAFVPVALVKRRFESVLTPAVSLRLPVTVTFAEATKLPLLSISKTLEPVEEAIFKRSFVCPETPTMVKRESGLLVSIPTLTA